MAFVHDRYLKIKNKTLGEDSLVDAILSGDETLKPLYEKARAIHLSPLKKGYVESCMLAEQDLEKIFAVIETPVDVLEMYREVFFNVKGFDKLSLLEQVETAEDPDEKGMKLWALSQGLGFIAWRLGKATKTNPVEGLQELFTMAVYKSKEALFSGNSAESSKEAAKWARLCTQISQLLKAWTSDVSAAREDLNLALSLVVPEFDSFDQLI